MGNQKTDPEKTTSFRKTYVNLGVFQFLTFLRRGVFYTFMITYLNGLMGAVTLTAALGTLNMVASSLGQNLLWGRICDRYQVRAKLIVAGELIAAFTYMIVFLVQRSLIDAGNSFNAGLSIIFGLSVLEFFWSMSDVGWAALLTDITTPKIRGRVVGTLNFIASLGRMAGILYSGFLFDRGEGFRNGTIFYIVTILLLAGAALMAFTSRRIDAKCTPTEQTNERASDKISKASEAQNERAYRTFLISLIIIILGAASVNQVFLLFLQLPNGLNFTDPQMTFVVSAWTIGGMIASLATGRFSDRFGRKNVLLLGLSLAVVTPLFYGYAASIPWMVLIYGLNGVSFWTVQTIGFVFAGDLIPQQRRGRLLSRFNTVIALSWGPAGMFIGGPFADLQVRSGISSYTAYVNAFYLSSFIVLIGTALFATRVARSRDK